MSENQGGDGSVAAPVSTGGGADFLETLPADLRGDGTLQGFKGSDGHVKLAKSYGELVRKFSGRNMADLDAPTDEGARRAVLAKLGAARPNTPGEYDLPDKPSAKQFREIAHQSGLSVSQAKALYESMDGAETKAMTDRKQAIEKRVNESRASLQGEWGEKFEDNAKLAQRGFEHFLPEGTRKMLEITGLNHDPAVVKLFNQLGRSLQEGTMMAGAGGGAAGVNTVEAAQKELNDYFAKHSAEIMSQNDLSPTVRQHKEHYGKLSHQAAVLKVRARQAAAAV